MIKYIKYIIPVCALVLIGYTIYFSSLLFGIWAALTILSLFISEKNPHIVYLSLAFVSLILNFVIKSQINGATLFPHTQIIVLICILNLGAGIDGLYWVKKWDRGNKLKTGYDN